MGRFGEVTAEIDNPFGPVVRRDLMDGLRIRAFVTGSHAYGQPHESDVDIVMLLDENILHLLATISGKAIQTDQYEQKPESASIRFDKLNIIAVTDPAEFAAWLEGTHDCIKLQNARSMGWIPGNPPSHVTRDEAKAIMKKAYERRNLEKAEPGSIS